MLALGTHNTPSELLEAQWTSQRQRLLLTPTGRHLLSRLGYPVLPNDVEDTTIALPPWVRRTIKVHPLPRNMSPEHDAGRRCARVWYLLRMLGGLGRERATRRAGRFGPRSRPVLVRPGVPLCTAGPQCTRGDPIAEPTLRLANGGLLALKGRQNPSLMREKASSATVVMSVATPRDHATRPTRCKGLLARRETGENLVIIHAGLNDVLKGKSQNLQRQLEDGVRKLREASEGVHVTICTIPEVWGQSGGMERRVIEANCVIRAMSRQLSYSVMEVNKDVYEPGLRPFAQDGIHYSGATGRRVGNRMGRQATAFLGGPSALRPPV
ncbi:hypothetical protein HPB52_007716 [Rhipicephalus sanguineus]|uniref:SGNH hydrolase-type esterase domain-containing protein n=1 Tax=Rhipicephalus sanguineus TaxID=34632 RepID=A0A9D4SUF6_RHISA|nr:hypothetical protein HPB52_007716 [Rhipicephalus sanguineus]